MKKTPLFSVLHCVSAAALIAAGALAPSLAFAQANKVKVCHGTGNGGYHLISVAAQAVRAHMAHGDVMPGETTSVGTPYAGLYGSMVTPLSIIGDDCSTNDVLRIDTTQNFSQNQPAGESAGWAGWSCVEPGYPKVVGGGYDPETATTLNSLAWKPGASVGSYSYPLTPWGYSYSLGEEGWIVQGAGPTPPASIYVICGQ